MAESLLDGYPVTLRWPVAWGDMDALGHVNNVAYFRWFESARIRFFETIGWAADASAGGVLPILGHTACSFRVPLAYPDTVILGARVDGVEEDRFTMRYRVVSEWRGLVAAEGEGRIVAFDYRDGRKARLPDSIRAAVIDLQAG